jgi:nitroimidazol reductase NimA-like FMN-containing flavoprotein (pyridoxamine 5'-phosphate oxidase superfamily)
MRRKEYSVTEQKQIEEIISKADVCRIAIANGNTPYIVTMNFGYSPEGKGRLYFHCAPEGRKLDMIRLNNHVCFEMDVDHVMYKGGNGCDWGMKYSSIVGYGNITVIADAEQKIKALNCIMDHYGGTGSYTYDEKTLARTKTLVLEITEMAAKKC